MKIKRSCLCWLLVSSLTLFSAFSVLANTSGDDSTEGNEVEGNFSYTSLNEISAFSVNDDLTGAYKLLPFYIESDNLAPTRQYGNVIHDIKKTSNISFYFNPYQVNNDGYFTNYSLEYVLTFENGYDPDIIGVTSSASGITGIKGFELHPAYTSNSRLPTGFRYVDENTIRISYSYDSSTSDSFAHTPYIILSGRNYLVGNSVKCELYFIRDYSSVATEGGDSGGSGSGGGSSAAT